VAQQIVYINKQYFFYEPAASFQLNIVASHTCIEEWLLAVS